MARLEALACCVDLPLGDGRRGVRCGTVVFAPGSSKQAGRHALDVEIGVRLLDPELDG